MLVRERGSRPLETIPASLGFRRHQQHVDGKAPTTTDACFFIPTPLQTICKAALIRSLSPRSTGDLPSTFQTPAERPPLLGQPRHRLGCLWRIHCNAPEGQHLIYAVTAHTKSSRAPPAGVLHHKAPRLSLDKPAPLCARLQSTPPCP